MQLDRPDPPPYCIFIHLVVGLRISISWDLGSATPLSTLLIVTGARSPTSGGRVDCHINSSCTRMEHRYQQQMGVLWGSNYATVSS